MGQILSQLLAIFYTKKLDIVVIGLENRYDRRNECIYNISNIIYTRMYKPVNKTLTHSLSLYRSH